ncbi:HET-domain-containing protein [Trametes sanguinea]|nr:HET-domain-containing protein [Trametes sanguinea]
MRLIHTKTGRFHLVDDPRTTRFAILSHVWARQNDPKFYPEPTLQDILRIQAEYDAEPADAPRTPIISRLPEKIRRFCETAAKYHFDLAWGDSFCIDKTSSSELSEALNSMFDWYRYARLCFVYLADVAPIANTAELARYRSQFRESRWYRRGWTLQELIAPTSLFFFSSEWTVIGSKHTLAPLIEEITQIPQDILTLQRPLETSSVACRMSWAVGRETTREEDEAYSLMGIFGVKITTTYGEGRYAFIRLQEEILKTISDQTLLAWGLHYQHSNRFIFQQPTEEGWLSPDMLQGDFNVKLFSPYQYLFASTPKDFRYCSGLVSVPWKDILAERPTYTVTSYGICTRLPVLSVRVDDRQMNAPTCIALLSCKMTNESGEDKFLALILRPQHSRTHHVSDSFVGTAVGRLRDLMGSVDLFSRAMDLTHYYRTVWLSRDQWQTCLNMCKQVEVYIPHRPVLAVYNMQRDADSHLVLYSVPTVHNRACDWFELRISKASEELLAMHGYHAATSTTKDPYTITIHSVTTSSSSGVIHIDVRRCDCHYGDSARFLSVTVSDSRKAPRGQPELHKVDDDRHVRSWSFKNGTASQDFLLKPSEHNRVTVRLSLTKCSPSSQWPVYILEIEIWETHKGDVRRAQERLHALMSGQGYGYLGGLAVDSAPPTPLTTVHASPLLTPDPSMQTDDQGLPWHGYDPRRTHLTVPTIRPPGSTNRSNSTSTVPMLPSRASTSSQLHSQTDYFGRYHPSSQRHTEQVPPGGYYRSGSLPASSSHARPILPALDPAPESGLHVLVEEPEELEDLNRPASQSPPNRKRPASPTGFKPVGESSQVPVASSRNSMPGRKHKGGRDRQRRRNSIARSGEPSQSGDRANKRPRI